MKRDKAPRERSATIRQDIIELMKRGPVTPFDLSGLLRVSEREAAFHLAHALETAWSEIPDRECTGPLQVLRLCL